MNDCLFCRIVAGLEPTNKVMETSELLAFHDINPQAPTHILIIPKKHIENNLAIHEEDVTLVGRAYLAANEIAQRWGIDESGFRVVTNTGMNAGQEIAHLHFHLLGGRPLAWPPG